MVCLADELGDLVLIEVAVTVAIELLEEPPRDIQFRLDVLRVAKAAGAGLVAEVLDAQGLDIREVDPRVTVHVQYIVIRLDVLVRRREGVVEGPVGLHNHWDRVGLVEEARFSLVIHLEDPPRDHPRPLREWLINKRN